MLEKQLPVLIAVLGKIGRYVPAKAAISLDKAALGTVIRNKMQKRILYYAYIIQ